MTYLLGLKTLHCLVERQDALDFHKAKLSQAMFEGDTEVHAFDFVRDHLEHFHALPHLDTLIAQFPEFKEISAPEPPAYYLAKLDERFAYNTLSWANVQSQAILKDDNTKGEQAFDVLKTALNRITEQRYRYRLMNFGAEAAKMVLDAYHRATMGKQTAAAFGWPYLDTLGGVTGGEIASLVGRPARGKTFLLLYTALHNWSHKKLNTLFVSMEMVPLLIAQRASAMYSHTNLSQLKAGGYATDTFKVFRKGLGKVKEEPAALYVVDGNVAANCEDIYTLAAQLRCSCVVIDGAYMVRHRNTRLDRYTRVAENMDLMKRLTTELDIPTFATWQFSREAVKKEKRKGGEKVGLEDIAFSDSVGQTSSIVLGLFQEESVETMLQRQIDVLKGRSGEVGQFAVHWDFVNMNFGEIEKDGPLETNRFI